jgi:hypothetical protein
VRHLFIVDPSSAANLSYSLPCGLARSCSFRSFRSLARLALTLQIDRLFKGPFTDRQGRFNYIEWAKVLRVNDGEGEKENSLDL